MARTRAELAPEAKREAIVGIARRMLVAEGFAGTSMAALAREAGVAPNTIYWWFENKDGVLVAVLDDLVGGEAGDELEMSDPPTPLVEQLLAVTRSFDGIERLLDAVHARAQVSERVRRWHEAFHDRSDAWLLARARRHLASLGAEPDEAEIAAIPRIWTFAIEGMVHQQVPPEERRVICETLVRQLEVFA